MSCCRSLSTADDALRHATDLQKDGLRLCQEEFLSVLKANSQEPNASKLVSTGDTRKYVFAKQSVVYMLLCQNPAAA